MIALVYFNVSNAVGRGVGSIGSLLASEGYAFAFYNTLHHDLGFLRAKLIDHQYSVLMISVMTLGLDDVTSFVNDVRRYSDIPVMIGGIGPTSEPKRVLGAIPYPDIYVCVGEGEGPISEWLKALGDKDECRKVRGIGYRDDSGQAVINPTYPLESLDKLPRFVWEMFPRDVVCSNGASYVSATRGCPYNCLTGDTLVDTLYGKTPIKELVGLDTVPVYTYDRANKEVVIADAINIRKYGIDKEVVRVHFDDGTHIDCTPDHKFLAFSYKNQVNPIEYEFVVEAQDLKPKMQLRAYKEYISPYGYTVLSWRRRQQAMQHRLVMQYKIGRKLTKGEVVHHIDKDKGNNHPDNLELFPSMKGHLAQHPEISERMKANDPAKNMTNEWREKLRVAITGKKRSDYTKHRLSISKIGERNPNYKNGEYSVVNHKVVNVEKLEKKEDVYCLTVPGYDWFFANNVLVKNCTYCANGVYLRTYGGKGYVRSRPVSQVIEEMEDLKQRFQTEFFYFSDEMALSDPLYAKQLFLTIADKLALPYGIMARPEALTPEMVAVLKDTGCQYLGIGVECGDEKFRRTYLNRNMSNDKIREAFRLTKEAGLFRASYNMLGFPVDNDDEITESTRQLNRELEPDYAQFTIFYPFPGTKLYTRCRDADLIDPERVKETRSYYQESCLRGKSVRPVADAMDKEFNPNGLPFRR